MPRRRSCPRARHAVGDMLGDAQTRRSTADGGPTLLCPQSAGSAKKKWRPMEKTRKRLSSFLVPLLPRLCPLRPVFVAERPYAASFSFTDGLWRSECSLSAHYTTSYASSPRENHDRFYTHPPPSPFPALIPHVSPSPRPHVFLSLSSSAFCVPLFSHSTLSFVGSLSR